MDHLDWIAAAGLVELTVALLILIGLVRRIRRVEDLLATPPPPPKESETVLKALADLTARVAETSGLADRLARIEEGLPDNSAVEAALAKLLDQVAVLERLVPERLGVIEKSIEDALSREAPEIHIEEQLKPLLAEAVEDLDGRLKSFSASLEKDRTETRSELVTRVLGDRGFKEVVVVDTADTEDGTTRLIVEAKRDGMSFKGPVLISDGRVVEQKLRPSYPMFP